MFDVHAYVRDYRPTPLGDITYQLTAIIIGLAIGVLVGQLTMPVGVDINYEALPHAWQAYDLRG